MNIEIIKQLDSLIVFLDQHYDLVNCHIVDYFTKNLYKNCIPQSIQDEISNLELSKIISDIFTNNLNQSSNLSNFINKSKSCSLYNALNICSSRHDFQHKLIHLTNNQLYLNSVKLNEFVTEKKSHEIQLMSNICAALNELADTSHVVDLGDGKGYLSGTLAVYYKLNVLGIEGSEIKTKAAIKQAENLRKVWHVSNKSVFSNDDDSVLYKRITNFVTEDTDIEDLVNNAFSERVYRLGLVGLHTCGNLSPTSLRMYAAIDVLKSICNVGCCYHLMNELFEGVNFNVNTSKAFPMSDYLISKRFSLGRQARMLAAHSIDRMLNKKALPTKSTFFRAVIEILLVDHFGGYNSKTIGRVKQPCATFVEYTKMACGRLGIDFKKSDAELNEFYMKYASRFDEMNVFYILRAMLAPTIESIILLDRLLFLIECGYNNSFLVALFDPVISPRCYAIISYK